MLRSRKGSGGEIMSESFGPGAAFDVFAKRERTGVLTQAVIGYVLISVIVGSAFVALAWNNLAAVFSAYVSVIQSSVGGATADAAQAEALVRALMPILPLLLLLQFASYLLLAALEAAVHRWLVRNEAGGGLLGLTLGADTWRVYLTYWLWLVVGIALYLGFVLAVLLFIGIGAAIGGGSQQSMAAGLFIFVGIVAACVPIIFVALRLAPAAATSIGRKRFAFFDAWRVTEGRALSMLGAYLILFALFLVAYLAFAIVISIIVVGPLVGTMAGGAAPDPQLVMTQIFSPPILAALGVSGLAYTAVVFMLLLAMMGINARAVRVALAEGRIEAPAA
jgi:hypothetical protein